jgi:hypothetical protein
MIATLRAVARVETDKALLATIRRGGPSCFSERSFGFPPDPRWHYLQKWNIFQKRDGGSHEETFSLSIRLVYHFRLSEF